MNVTHTIHGWMIFESENRVVEDVTVKVVTPLSCLRFGCLADALGYARVVWDGTIALKCEACGSTKGVEPEACSFGFLLSCKRCRSVPSTYAPPSDAERGKPLKKPRPGLRETEAEFLAATLKLVRHHHMETTGSESLDRKLKLPRAPHDPKYAEQGMVIAPSEAPPECQLCGDPITDSFVDGVVLGAGWAFLCVGCHDTSGIGWGHGRGHLFERQGAGDFIFVEGPTPCG